MTAQNSSSPFQVSNWIWLGWDGVVEVHHMFFYMKHQPLQALSLIIHFNLLQSLGGNIISRATTSDLNPVLAAGGCILNLTSKGTGAKKK